MSTVDPEIRRAVVTLSNCQKANYRVPCAFTLTVMDTIARTGAGRVCSTAKPVKSNEPRDGGCTSTRFAGRSVTIAHRLPAIA